MTLGHLRITIRHFLGRGVQGVAVAGSTGRVVVALVCRKSAKIGQREDLGAMLPPETRTSDSSGVEPITGSGASVMRHWALRLGREARPCIRSRERRGARGEPAGESNGRAANWGHPHKATATALQCELKNGKALGFGRQK